MTGDINTRFHQVRQLEKDKPLLRFLWWDLKTDQTIYQWEVLLFRKKCSPYCAKNVAQQSHPDEDIHHSVQQCFYVDNCLQSLPSPDSARVLIDKLRASLATGGLKIQSVKSLAPIYHQICLGSWKLESDLPHLLSIRRPHSYFPPDANLVDLHCAPCLAFVLARCDTWAVKSTTNEMEDDKLKKSSFLGLTCSSPSWSPSGRKLLT